MVTYGELFQLAIVITGVATLFYHIGRHTGKGNDRPSPKVTVISISTKD